MPVNRRVVGTFGEARWLLSHGDALCIADTDYMAFRAQVRAGNVSEVTVIVPGRTQVARTIVASGAHPSDRAGSAPVAFSTSLRFGMLFLVWFEARA